MSTYNVKQIATYLDISIAELFKHFEMVSIHTWGVDDGVVSHTPLLLDDGGLETINDTYWDARHHASIAAKAELETKLRASCIDPRRAATFANEQCVALLVAKLAAVR